MKANQPLTINKKLILHFDIDNVIRLPNNTNKDYYVYNMCADWVWGKLEYNAKDDPNKVTGWKLCQNTLSIQQLDPEFISYKKYIDEHANIDKQQKQKLIINLSKGPAAKAKAQIQKNIKNITIPKTLIQALIQSPDKDFITKKYLEDSKYQILPAFYKLILSLKKSKRQFSIILHNANPQDNHQNVIEQLNMFFTGEHPLYNGKNGTPLVKFDGSKGVKNFIIDQMHQSSLYCVNETDIFATFGTSSKMPEQKDLQMFKQRLKSRKNFRFCENVQQIYSFSHVILSESACIYYNDPTRLLIVDEVDYQTQQIYFTNSAITAYNSLGEKLQKIDDLCLKVSLFEMLKDVDFFIKKIQVAEAKRVQDIQKRQKGEQPHEQQAPAEQQNDKKQVLSNSEYLKKNLIPILDGALRQVDIFRPQDPIGFIALYCLKHKERLES